MELVAVSISSAFIFLVRSPARYGAIFFHLKRGNTLPCSVSRTTATVNLRVIKKKKYLSSEVMSTFENKTNNP